MEALAAFGLAASVLQVVDFSTKVLSSANEIAKNGSTNRNAELTTITEHLRSLNDSLLQSCGPELGAEGPLSKDDQVCLIRLPS